MTDKMITAQPPFTSKGGRVPLIAIRCGWETPDIDRASWVLRGRDASDVLGGQGHE